MFSSCLFRKRCIYSRIHLRPFYRCKAGQYPAGKAKEYFVVTISDDGDGICEADRTKDRSFGLQILRERANIIHASLDIHSEKGGTEIEVKIPLAK